MGLFNRTKEDFLKDVRKKEQSEITISFSRRPDAKGDTDGVFRTEMFIILSAKHVKDFQYFETCCAADAKSGDSDYDKQIKKINEKSNEIKSELETLGFKVNIAH